MAPPHRLLTVQEAAADLRVRPRTLLAWVRRGEINAIVKFRRDGRPSFVRFLEKHLDDFIRRHENSA